MKETNIFNMYGAMIFAHESSITDVNTIPIGLWQNEIINTKERETQALFIFALNPST